jgi:hypothetical protein
LEPGGRVTTGFWGSGAGYRDGANVLARARKEIEIFFASRAGGATWARHPVPKWESAVIAMHTSSSSYPKLPIDGSEGNRMSRARVSERHAPKRLQASALSKRRWQDAVGEIGRRQWVNPESGVDPAAALGRSEASGRRPIGDEGGRNKCRNEVPGARCHENLA